MRRASLLMYLALPALALTPGQLRAGSPESAESNEARLARCAWSEAPATAAVLVARAKFDKRYVYDADGSPTVGPLMRIRAACREQSIASADATGVPLARFDYRKFLKLLAGSKPAQIGADRFAGVVRRCEYRFLDDSKGEPAAVVWSIDTGSGPKDVDRRERMLGLEVTDAEFAALMSPKKSPPASLFARAEAAKPVRVSTLAAGKASKQPYSVDLENSDKRCSVVKADGSYEDA